MSLRLHFSKKLRLGRWTQSCFHHRQPSPALWWSKLTWTWACCCRDWAPPGCSCARADWRTWRWRPRSWRAPSGSSASGPVPAGGGSAARPARWCVRDGPRRPQSPPPSWPARTCRAAGQEVTTGGPARSLRHTHRKTAPNPYDIDLQFSKSPTNVQM